MFDISVLNVWFLVRWSCGLVGQSGCGALWCWDGWAVGSAREVVFVDDSVLCVVKLSGFKSLVDTNADASTDASAERAQHGIHNRDPVAYPDRP